jgi:hypothetical protein
VHRKHPLLHPNQARINAKMEKTRQLINHGNTNVETIRSLLKSILKSSRLARRPSLYLIRKVARFRVNIKQLPRNAAPSIIVAINLINTNPRTMKKSLVFSAFSMHLVFSLFRSNIVNNPTPEETKVPKRRQKQKKLEKAIPV